MIDGPALDRVLARIDERNSADPRRLRIGDDEGPKELVAGRRATHWLRRLHPDAGPAQLIAARGHHVERWRHPRQEFPEGRRGYLQWRRTAQGAHAELVGRLAAQEGASEDDVELIGRLIRKDGLGEDPLVQHHEDSLCLVFVESQFDETIELVGRDPMVRIVARTLTKMSPEAIALAAALDLSPSEREILEAATAEVADGS